MSLRSALERAMTQIKQLTVESGKHDEVCTESRDRVSGVISSIQGVVCLSNEV